MAGVLGCDTKVLIQDAKCLLCLSATELKLLEAYLREQRFSGAANTRTAAALLKASKLWDMRSEQELQAMEVFQLCNDNIIVGARTSCEADTLMREVKCWCPKPSMLSPHQLDAIIAYLKCLQRQT